jgi:hypothetical protein
MIDELDTANFHKPVAVPRIEACGFGVEGDFAQHGRPLSHSSFVFADRRRGTG